MMRSPMKGVILSALIILFSFSAMTYGTNSSDDIQTQINNYKVRLEQAKSSGDKIEMVRYALLLGNTYRSIDVSGEAIDYYLQAAELSKSLGNQNALKTLYSDIGNLYDEDGQYQRAVEYYEKSLAAYRNTGDVMGEISVYLNIARSFQSLGYYAESNTRAERAREKASGIEQTKRSVELNRMLAESYRLLADNYEALGDSEKSTEMMDYYAALKKQLARQEKETLEQEVNRAEQMARSSQAEASSIRDTLLEVMEINELMQERYLMLDQIRKKDSARAEAVAAQLRAEEEEDKAKEEQSKAEKRTQNTRLVALIILLALAALIILLVLRQTRSAKKANEILTRQKNEIEHQHTLVKQQQKRITDSIQYAQRIQKAVLPPDRFFDQNFNDYFILYRPRDIVSGDFYWSARKDNVLILAVADCTGHGVPGAFMSMLGVACLNEIVNKIAINQHISTLNADDILNELRQMIISSLRQTSDISQPRDGMDIALCLIDYKNKKLQYAGANNPLYLIRNGELQVYKADKMPISYHQRKDVPFQRHDISWNNDDRLYLFSDGYIDQFGGKQGLKFMSKRFKDTLLSIHSHSMAEQARLLENTFNDWRGDNPPLDDVLVIGIRLGAKVPSPGSTQALNWNEKTILIAEDTDVNYFLLTAVLKPTQANLVRVKDGLEAIEFIKNNEVDLILMDINMPNMNGYEATKVIKEIRKDIPVIIQTAMPLSDDDKEVLECRADDVIKKPIDLKTFITKLERFLS